VEIVEEKWAVLGVKYGASRCNLRGLVA